MSRPFWQFQPDMVHDWAYMDNIFTPEECQQIISIGNQKLEKAEVKLKENDPIAADKIRESQVSWLYANDVEFAFRRVTDAVMNLNNRFFNFDLFGFAEGFQFTRYDAPTGHYGMHIDKFCGGPVRKLSVTIQLSSPEDYYGGDLCFKFNAGSEVMAKDLGKMIVFPSYVLHEVSPVTKGTRYSLVSWITGKPFR